MSWQKSMLFFASGAIERLPYWSVQNVHAFTFVLINYLNSANN